MGSKNGKPVLREEDITALSKSSGLEGAQVQEAFDAFVAEHPNGRMKPKDFRTMMSQALPKKDANFVEFMVIFYIMSDGAPEDVLGKIFRVFDVNSDGTITKKELNRLIKDMYGLLKTEDPKIAAKDLIAKSAFAEMDKDEDGKVSTDEFITACLSQEEFSKMLAIKVIDIFVEDDD
eukprot:GFUD01063897.1.p1 GENE.GFUD01063897.1~~GFUD01063897.1.p1  ORF type:complete len:177 (-),score=56.87 GFUD01063897.1:96-626(-)